MATIPLTTNERQYGGAVSDGNLTTCQFAVKTNAASIVQGSPYATAAASGDIIDLGPLQEGMRLEDAPFWSPASSAASPAPIWRSPSRRPSSTTCRPARAISRSPR